MNGDSRRTNRTEQKNYSNSGLINSLFWCMDLVGLCFSLVKYKCKLRGQESGHIRKERDLVNILNNTREHNSQDYIFIPLIVLYIPNNITNCCSEDSGFFGCTIKCCLISFIVCAKEIVKCEIRFNSFY